MGKDQEKPGFLARIAETFDLPGEVVAGQTVVTITGFRRVLIEKHQGLLEYQEEVISLKCGRGLVRVKGRGLDLKAMTEEAVLIFGDIAGVEYEM